MLRQKYSYRSSHCTGDEILNEEVYDVPFILETLGLLVALIAESELIAALPAHLIPILDLPSTTYVDRVNLTSILPSLLEGRHLVCPP